MKISKNLIEEEKNDFVPLSRDAEGQLKGGFGSLDVEIASVNAPENNCLCRDNNCSCPTHQMPSSYDNCSCPIAEGTLAPAINNCHCGKVVTNNSNDPLLPSLF